MRAVTVCSLLLMASMGAFASIDQGLLSIVPGDTRLLTGVDVSHARSSAFGQYVLRRVDNEDDHFREFVRDTGFDPRRDLEQFMFASSGTSTSGGNSRFAILGRGTFDPVRIASTSKARGGSVRHIEGLDLIVHENGGQETAIAFPDTGVAVMGDLATVEEVVRHRSTASTLDPKLVDRVNAVGADNDFWFVSLASARFLQEHLDTPAGGKLGNSEALQSIQESEGGIRFGDTVTLSFRAATRSPQDATSLADVMRFASSMVQTQRQTDPRASIVASALDQMKLETSGNTVQASLAMSENSLEQLAEAGPKQTRDRTQPSHNRQ